MSAKSKNTATVLRSMFDDAKIAYDPAVMADMEAFCDEPAWRSALSALRESTRREVLALPRDMDALREAPIVRKWCASEGRHITSPMPPDWPHWCMHRGTGIIPIWRESLVRSLTAWLWWEERAVKLRYRRPIPRWAKIFNPN